MCICFVAVSGAGSTGGAFGDAAARGSGNLGDVEEADIEAGEILTALKSSPSPIRFDDTSTRCCLCTMSMYTYS